MPQQRNYEGLTNLIRDADVARLLSISRSWVRKERFNRRHGNPHSFNLDPILIGTAPRYRLTDVVAWIEAKAVAKGDAA